MTKSLVRAVVEGDMCCYESLCSVALACWNGILFVKDCV